MVHFKCGCGQSWQVVCAWRPVCMFLCSACISSVCYALVWMVKTHQRTPIFHLNWPRSTTNNRVASSTVNIVTNCTPFDDVTRAHQSLFLCSACISSICYAFVWMVKTHQKHPCLTLFRRIQAHFSELVTIHKNNRDASSTVNIMTNCAPFDDVTHAHQSFPSEGAVWEIK